MSLYVPLGIIPRPPEHRVTAVCVRNADRVATGSSSGQCVLWRRNELEIESESDNGAANLFSPIAFLDGHSTRVSTLATCVFEWTPAIASASSDGTICLWDPDDGRCLLRQSNVLPAEPTQCVMLPTSRELAICGHFQGIHIVDCSTLEVVTVAGTHHGWFTGLRPIQDVGTLLSLTQNGKLVKWMCDEGSPREIPECVPLQTSHERTIRSMDCTRSGTLVLAVGPAGVAIHEAETGSEVAAIAPPEDRRWKYGRFISEDSFVLSTTTGEMHCYTLLRSTGAQCTAVMGAPEVGSGHAFAVGDGLVVRGDEEGQLLSWKADDIFVPAVEGEPSGGLQNLPAASAARLDDGWEGKGESGATASLVLVSNGDGMARLLQGYKSGVLKMSVLPSDPQPSTLQAHNASVSHFLAPSIPDSDRPLAISASSDGTLLAWLFSRVPDGKPMEPIWRHDAQMEITILSQPKGPGQAACPFFIFVGADHSVGVVDFIPSLQLRCILGPHKTAPVGFFWRPASKHLCVLCQGGEVPIWELENTTLDRVATSLSTVELVEQSEGEQVRAGNSMVEGLQRAATVLQRAASTESVVSQGSVAPADGSASSVQAGGTSRWLQVLPVRLGEERSSGTKKSGSTMVIGIKRMAAELHLVLKDHTKEDAGPSPINACASASFAYVAISYLPVWNMNASLDMLKKQASLAEPDPPLLQGIRGHAGVVTYMVPTASAGWGRWRFSSYMSAVQALSVVSLARLLLSLGCNNEFCVEMITEACVAIPESVPQYCSPSLSLLARYWDDTWEDLQDAARTLLTATIKRMTPAERRHMVELWESRMSTTDLTVPKGVAVVILGIIGCLDPDVLEPSLISQIGLALVHNIHQAVPQSALAADILARGFQTYRRHVGNLRELLLVLFDYVATGDPKRPTFAERVRGALILIAANAPPFFLEAMGDIGADTGVLMAHKVLTVKLIGSVIAKFSQQFEVHSQTIVDYIMSLLNPGVPARREACLRACTLVLRQLCQNYGFVSFHQDSQKYAVGTQTGTVVVYDLRTATKWRILQGQTGPITAAAFDPGGKKVASYCYEESTIRVFQAGSYGMFEMFGLSGSSLSQASVPRLPFPLTSQPVSLLWDSDGKVVLMQAQQRVIVHNT